MHRRFLNLLLCLFLAVNVLSAQSTISGYVRTSAGDGIPDVAVVIKNPKDSLAFAYVYTNSQGAYSIHCNKNYSHIIIAISAFDIVPESKVIENKTQQINFTPKIESLKINEVVVKADKIREKKDTLVYSVASFINHNDYNIEDVIKKMPGLSVSSTGQLSYQGKPINKLYVEGKDLLEGRYNIATKNIAAKDVASIEVMDKHEHIKMLKDVTYSDGVAINIKLKDDAKGTYTMHALLGAGWMNKFLWKNELFGVYFGKKRQHILSYKTN